MNQDIEEIQPSLNVKSNQQQSNGGADLNGKQSTAKDNNQNLESILKNPDLTQQLL